MVVVVVGLAAVGLAAMVEDWNVVGLVEMECVVVDSERVEQEIMLPVAVQC